MDAEKTVVWTSDLVRRIIGNALTPEEAEKRGYNSLSFEDFAFERSIGSLRENPVVQLLGPRQVAYCMTAWEGIGRHPERFLTTTPSEEKPDFSLGYEGRSGASFRQADVYVGDTNQLFIPIGVKQHPWIPKHNRIPALDKVEFKVMRALSEAQVLPIAKAKWKFSTLYVERLFGHTLFQEAYFGLVSREEVKERFGAVIKDAVHAAVYLTQNDVLDASDKGTIFDDKYGSLEQKLHLSRDTVEENYHALKIREKYGISESTALQPLQELLNQANQDSVWITDRSPKNYIGGKAFDFGKIDYTHLATELTFIIDMLPQSVMVNGLPIPGYFTRKEREVFLQKVVAEWNAVADNQINFDDNFLNAYDAHVIYRAVLNAGHCLVEAEKCKNEKQGTPFYFEYAKLIGDAQAYMDLALESTTCLMGREALTNDEGRALWKTIHHAYDAKRDHFAEGTEWYIDYGIAQQLNESFL